MTTTNELQVFLDALGDGPYWVANAEHTQGKSVSHPCRFGVFDDPTNEWVGVLAAADEEEANSKATHEFQEFVKYRAEPCECERQLCAGSDSWWDSVCVAVNRITVDDLHNYHPCDIIE